MFPEDKLVGRVIKLHWEPQFYWHALVQTKEGLVNVCLDDCRYRYFITATKDLYRKGKDE